MSRTSRRLRLAVLAAAAVALAEAPLSSASVPAPAMAVSPPQGSTLGFATLRVVTVQGQALSFLNADAVTHTVTSVATRPVKVRYGRKTYTVRVPLFDSGPVAAAALGDVKGVTNLKPGTYDFLCALHTGMKAQLVVAKAPAATSSKG